jgi:hypothetical protein
MAQLVQSHHLVYLYPTVSRANTSPLLLHNARFFFSQGFCTYYDPRYGQPPTSVRASLWLNEDNHPQMTGWARHLVAPDEPNPNTLDEARTQLSVDA